MLVQIIKCMRGDVGNPPTSQIYGLLCGASVAAVNPAVNPDGHSQQLKDWNGSNRRAFIRLIGVLADGFVQNPDSVCQLLTGEAEDEEKAGTIMASFIYWLSPKRCGLPDIRTQAIKASNTPPCHSLPPCHAPFSNCFRIECRADFHS